MGLGEGGSDNAEAVGGVGDRVGLGRGRPCPWQQAGRGRRRSLGTVGSRQSSAGQWAAARQEEAESMEKKIGYWKNLKHTSVVYTHPKSILTPSRKECNYGIVPVKVAQV